MANVVCGRCRHEHPVGARVCEACGSRLFALELRRAMGRNPWYWLQGTAVGQMAPFLVVALLLVAGWQLGPAAASWRQLLLNFGLIGIVTLGVTFPLMKGHYDFSTGSLAGLVACTAALLSPYGYGTVVLGAMGVGLVAGLLNGYLVGWTRIPSAMVTIMTGAISLQLTLYLTARTRLAVSDPLLLSVGDTDVWGVPVILALFVVGLACARLLFNRESFRPVGVARSGVQVAALTSPGHVLLSFLVSGGAAGLGGLLIACSSLAIIGTGGQMLWMLTPLTAALVGGGSVTVGTGNLRTAAIGAACLALINWLVAQLRMPISGPVVEAPLLVGGLLADRWKNMTWYMIAQARRGNLLALADEMQLPMLVRVWKATPWPVRVASALGLLALSVGLYLYVAFYVAGRVPEGTAVAREVSGLVQVTRYGFQHPEPLVAGASLRPGDTVTTGRGARALLRFADGSLIRVYEGSELYVQDLQSGPGGGSTTQLRVAVGSFFAKVHKLLTPDSSFTVQTPVLTLGVRGTAFQMSVGAGRGSVAVGEGAVAISRQVEVEQAGARRYLEDTRTVDAGKQAEAGADTLVTNLNSGQLAALQSTALDVLRQARQQQLEAVRSGAHRGLWVFVAVLYLIFLLCLKPEPPYYIGDVMAERARYFSGQHTASAADSPRAAALAQMYLRAGEIDKARAEIQAIMQHDPNSEYGHWARRYSLEFERQQRREAMRKRT